VAQVPHRKVTSAVERVLKRVDRTMKTRRLGAGGSEKSKPAVGKKDWEEHKSGTTARELTLMGRKEPAEENAQPKEIAYSEDFKRDGVS